MKYNTARDHLVLPEYGRNVQKMVDHAIKLSKAVGYYSAGTVEIFQGQFFSQSMPDGILVFTQKSS